MFHLCLLQCYQTWTRHKYRWLALDISAPNPQTPNWSPRNSPHAPSRRGEYRGLRGYQWGIKLSPLRWVRTLETCKSGLELPRPVLMVVGCFVECIFWWYRGFRWGHKLINKKLNALSLIFHTTTIIKLFKIMR